jgi:KaiC/GvpD/RAD55 family RecA-like ATPase
MTTLLDVDVPGLDLVLGGGIRLLRRVDGARESATLLIRGPAGSGKTILGTQLAASIARKLNSDVAYGCVELLPVELRAQHETLRGKGFKEQVVPLGEHVDIAEPEGSFVRIYAGLLDLGDEGQAVERLGDAVEALLNVATKRAGRSVRVLVLDSLSDGYGLGSRAPRILADGISKLAADEGLIVVLLEETADERPSVWNFAVDTVFELGWVEVGGRLRRKLRIPKNRLGAMVSGPHGVSIAEQRGLIIYPSIGAYDSNLARKLLTPPSVQGSPKHPWALKMFEQLDWLPAFRSCVTAVVGLDANAVWRFALGVGAGDVQSPLDTHLWGDVIFKVGPAGVSDRVIASPAGGPPMKEVWLGLSSIDDGAGFLDTLRFSLESLYKLGKSPRRIVVGDLRDLRYHPNAQDIVAAIAVAGTLLKGLKIPLVLFDTLEGPTSTSAALALADVSITWGVGGAYLRVVDLLTRREESISGAVNDLILVR